MSGGSSGDGYRSRMAPGQHCLKLISGYRTLFRHLYMEDWVCLGCQLRFCLKGGLAEDVNIAVQYLRLTHAGLMSDDLVRARLSVLQDGLATGQLPDVVTALRDSEMLLAAHDAVDCLPYFFVKSVRLKLDWSSWKLMRKGVTWR